MEGEAAPSWGRCRGYDQGTVVVVARAVRSSSPSFYRDFFSSNVDNSVLILVKLLDSFFIPSHLFSHYYFIVLPLIFSSLKSEWQPDFFHVYSSIRITHCDFLLC